MVLGLLVIIFVVVLLAFFFGLNLSNICTIWFFKTFTDVPVSMLVLVAFAAGIVFAFICVLISKFRSSPKIPEKSKMVTKDKINSNKSLLKKSEKALKNSDNNSDATIVADSIKPEKN